jgi:hypothetical protein
LAKNDGFYAVCRVDDHQTGGEGGHVFPGATTDIAFSIPASENTHMGTLAPNVLADMKKATELALSGKKDPEFTKRVQDEAKKVRAEILKRNGLLDVGTPAIRELRDEVRP